MPVITKISHSIKRDCDDYLFMWYFWNDARCDIYDKICSSLIRDTPKLPIFLNIDLTSH